MFNFPKVLNLKLLQDVAGRKLLGAPPGLGEHERFFPAVVEGFGCRT